MTSSGYLVVATISLCLLVSALAKSANPEEIDSASMLQSSLEQDPEVILKIREIIPLDLLIHLIH
jgi:hypothetical protein